MELWQVEVFLAVAEERSFSRAGQRLGRTQPAISSAIKSLEGELGELLFDRIGKSVKLTSAGEMLTGYAGRMLRIRSEVFDAIGEMRSLGRGRLSLGANETTCLYVLPDVLAAFKKTYPQVQVEIQRAITRVITRNVIEGSLDFGIVTLPVTSPRLETITSHRDKLVLIVSPQHRLASRKVVQMAELEGEPFILHKVGTTTRERLVKQFSDAGVVVRVTMELASIETIKRFVSIGMGISIVPRLCIARELDDGSLLALGIRNSGFRRRLGLIYNKQRHLSQAARAFLSLVTEVQKPKAAGKA
jgi:DNA-binding transcriptional LysR family regulator